MRYLITVSSLTPGSGLTRYVFSLCRLLAKDNEVWVMTTHDDGSIAYERNELDSISKDIHLISLGSKGKLSKYANVLRWIYRIKPDIIVNNFNATVQFVLPAISHRIKVVHVLHADIDEFYRIAAINGKRVTGWVAPTQAVANAFNSYTSNRFQDRVKIIPHGVDEQNPVKKGADKLTIAFAGVIYEHKGVQVLPPIIKTLIKNGVNLKFTVIGKGILLEWLQEQFAQEIEEGHVELTGVIPHKEVYDHVSKADIFLYPTHLDSFGLVIAEAMMCGAVPVVTLLPGITDNLITDGVDGYLLEKDNVDQFVNKIMLLNSDSELRKKMQTAAYNTAKTKLSLSTMQKNYIEFFNNL